MSSSNTSTSVSGSNSVLVFIAGMHRTGTSALCAALHARGVNFGNDLIEAIVGVNDEGFWEDREFVEINERLLEASGLCWYTVGPQSASLVREAVISDGLKQQACNWLANRMAGAGSIVAVKDPRVCVTLPFWQSLCESLEITHHSVCVDRPPLEVALSLQKRDHFPISYGLRLYAAYHHCLHTALQGQQVSWLSFNGLIQDADTELGKLATALPMLDLAKGGAGLQAQLRHHSSSETEDGVLALSMADGLNLMELDEVIEQHYPQDELAPLLAQAFVARGEELTSLGQEHSAALATLDERDGDIIKLGQELNAAVATVAQRDTQLSQVNAKLDDTGQHLEAALATLTQRDKDIDGLDGRLQALGEEHSYALTVLSEYDQRIEKLSNTPLLGLLFKVMWKYAGR